MGVILFTIIFCTLVFIGFLIYRSEDEDAVGVVHPTFSNKHDLQEQFKEAYLWACKTFGVHKSVYDTLEEDVRSYSGLGVPYFTYYHVSHYSGYYPNIPRVSSNVHTWNDKEQQRAFALEFISLVNSMRNRVDVEDFELFNKYEIPFKNLLTKEFKVDKVSLHQIPE